MILRSRTLFASLVAACLLVPLAGPAATAQERPPSGGRQVSPVHPAFQLYAYTLRYKPAAEALVLIRPLLSKQGSLELQPETNTLVVRDTLAALGRIVPALRAYDRPPEELRIEMMIVRAYSRPVPARPGRTLPPWLEEKLRSLLRWDYYQVLADSRVDVHEGQGMTHELGGLYGVSFDVGTLLHDERVRLSDFKVWRAGSGEVSPVGADHPLLEATLHLWLDKPKVLGLANSESSDHALMVVLTCQRRESPSRRPGGGGR